MISEILNVQGRADSFATLIWCLDFEKTKTAINRHKTEPAPPMSVKI